MLLFKKLTGGRYCIIEDDSVFVFDKMGKCIKENEPISPDYLNYAVTADYISVLSSGKRLEVAICINGKLDVFTCSIPAQNCVMQVFSNYKSTCFLRRDGKIDNISYNQAVFIYPEGYLVRDDVVKFLDLKR